MLRTHHLVGYTLEGIRVSAGLYFEASCFCKLFESATRTVGRAVGLRGGASGRALTELLRCLERSYSEVWAGERVVERRLPPVRTPEDPKWTILDHVWAQTEK